MIEPVPALPTASGALTIDCASCTVRPVACGDCVVSFLLGGVPGDDGGLDATEVAALAVLADSGLVPPLRLVPRAT